jgi:phosphopantetheine adenylyltransferase
MGELLNFLVESILLEAAPIDKQIVVYSGRFQPFHKGHFATYQNLVKKFGSDSVYIGTSNVTDNKKSPFNFNEKKAIMTKMFGIPSSKIVNVKNPYAPSEILNKYDEDRTGLIVVVGEKDENRLGGKYFTPYKGKVEEPYLVRGYVYASPSTANPISGTDVRYWLSAGSEEERKKNFTKAYPKFDDQIFKLITLKLKKLKECINEEIKLNVKVGDTLLMGKFKNKKVVVKNIGEDEWGMPTINGKKAVTFRIPKKENLKEIGLGGGAGVGLSLPGGYINGAPDSKDVKKNSKKLNNKGMSGYEEIDEDVNSDTIECSKCGWKWKKTEGGEHPYTCHKCGNDNEPKITEATASEIIKDLDKVKTDLLKKVDVLITKKKKLYSNVDIESPMSADEKKLDKDIQTIFSQIQQIIQQKRKIKENINESLLIEGGAYGHMSHPFDIEMNLTFGDLKQIVVRALNGDLELAREKTDGQALAVSWVNGRLVAARNKSHLKNKGEGAMTIGQVAAKFAGRGGLTDAYNFAMQDLSKAIGALSEPQRKKVFKDGSSFMNLEVIYPTSVNVIPYNQPLLVFHGTFDYDINGTIVGENQQAASILGGMIKQVNAHVQSKYTIQGPPINKLPKSEHLSKLQGKYLGMISKLQNEFKLADSDGVADYHQAWWTDFVEKKAKKLDYQQKIGLVKRWAFGDKSFRIAEITDDKIRAWADTTDKQDQQKIGKQNLMRFEEIFLGVGADVLSFMDSVLTANPDSAKRQMVARLQSTISQVKASGDPKKIEKLKLELSRLNALGGFEKIVPNEGIVFVYGGNTYKLTGAFAPLNQILGIFFDK